MKYIMLESDENGLSLAGKTTDPLIYAQSYEPIDALNGKLLAVSEANKVYAIIDTSAEALALFEQKSLVVDVGDWRALNPILILQNDVITKKAVDYVASLS